MAPDSETSVPVPDVSDVHFDGTNTDVTLTDELRHAVAAFQEKHPSLGTKEKPIHLRDLAAFAAKG